VRDDEADKDAVVDAVNEESRADMAMIVAENVSKTYPSGGGSITVLNGIDLEIEPQAFVAIVGPSGSGKTTLLGLLAGLDRPTRGRVWLDGTRLDEIDEDARARLRAEKVGFVFQTFQLLPTLTALENVQVPLELKPRAGPGVSRAATEERARTLLERVGLGERVDHYPVQLSGGEQQRVGLARAFAHEPTVLFADEPTGNLDRQTGRRVIALLRELNEEARTTLVLVTHDLELAGFADRILRLESGTLQTP
jgi:putative ABC transport system ATP-binding protein